MGRLPDTEVAERVGVSPGTVRRTRAELGIARTPKPSAATSGSVGARLRAMPKAELRRLLAKLDPIDARIIEGRKAGRLPKPVVPACPEFSGRLALSKAG